MHIGTKKIGEDQSVFIICEGGVTNYGDVRIAEKQVDAAILAEADAIKFQAWKTEALVSKYSSEVMRKESGFDWFTRLSEKEMTYEEIENLFRYSGDRGIAVFATPHDEESLDFLVDQLRQKIIKIGSGAANNFEFLRRVGQKTLPVLISFGFQEDREIEKAVDVLLTEGTSSVVALHCVSLYPTPSEYANLRRIDRLRRLLNVPIGVSDHSIGWHIPLAALSLGVCVIEKHLTFDKSDPRSVDNPGALLPAEFQVFVKQVREIEEGLRPVNDATYRTIMQHPRTSLGQGLVAKVDLPSGTVLSTDLIACKRPLLNGLSPESLPDIVGRKTTKLILKDEQILMDALG